jgi:hypothetical protein
MQFTHHSLEAPPGCNPSAYYEEVQTWFQAFAFEINLHRYTTSGVALSGNGGGVYVTGFFTDSGGAVQVESS